MTFSLYSQFIEAGKCENYSVRMGKVSLLECCNFMILLKLLFRFIVWCSSCLIPITGCWRCC